MPPASTPAWLQAAFTHIRNPTRSLTMVRSLKYVLAASVLIAIAGLALVVAQSPAGRKPAGTPASKNVRVASAPRTKPAKPAAAAKPVAVSKPAAAPRRPGLAPAPRTVQSVLDSFGIVAARRYRSACTKAGITWPPARLHLLAFKRERKLEVWAAGPTGTFVRIGRHSILAANGGLGPKRIEGDGQVPEGFYDLAELNPNSSMHLSVRIAYPNAEDIANASVPRSQMGGDIYLHGDRLSIGCIAVGDRAIEELFPLVAMVPTGRRRIVIAPFDFRRHPGAAYPKEAAWVHRLYDRIKQHLKGFPA